ncbi:hypothetical protein MMC30_005381 [Trapelia coarctata]|nr:hypothetical protein [Trapelia coarctata]
MTTRYTIPRHRRFLSTPRYVPTSQRTATTVISTIIGTCVSVHLLTQYAESRAKETGNITPVKRIHEHLVLSARNVREGRWWTLLTHTFTHFTLTHMAFNMLGLWTFGRPMVMLFGVRNFLALWVGAGITGGAASLMVESANNAADGKGILGGKREGETSYIGASGSVLGIGAAFAATFPLGSMYIFPIPVPMYNWIAFVGYATYSVYAQTNGLQGNIGHLGHLGGMAFGALYWLVRLRRPF